MNPLPTNSYTVLSACSTFDIGWLRQRVGLQRGSQGHVRHLDLVVVQGEEATLVDRVEARGFTSAVAVERLGGACFGRVKSTGGPEIKNYDPLHLPPHYSI